MSPLPTPQESGYADVNGVKIWYQTYGEGDPLVLIHGGFGSVGCSGRTSRLCREVGRSSASTSRRTAAPARSAGP